MNPDYIIGSKQPHILFADYVGDTSNLSNADNTDGSKAAKVASAGASTPEADHELTFDDLVDIVNPLQHIPLVNYVYRAITGDKISGFATIAGSALYGGPLGIVGGVVEAAFNDETGHGPAETMVADILGLEDHATMVASADRSPKQEKTITSDDMLDTQIASAMGAPETLDTQVAMAMPKPETLDTQVAEATLPPVGPSPVLVAQGKQPYGGIMDMDRVNKARAGAPNIHQMPNSGNVAIAAAQQSAPAAVPIAATMQPQEAPDGTKFYSLAKAKRLSPGTNVAMPVNGGPDVRMKNVSRISVGKAAPSAPIQIPTDDDATARAILGLPEADAPQASNDPSGNLTPATADLLPAYGQKSQSVPNALIEDMMKMGLDKYQKGLSNGTLGGTAPSIDVRG